MSTKTSLIAALLLATMSSAGAQETYYRFSLPSPLLAVPESSTPPAGGGNTVVTAVPAQDRVYGRAPLPIDVDIAIHGGSGGYSVTDNSDQLAFVPGAEPGTGKVTGTAWSTFRYWFTARDTRTGATSDPAYIDIEMAPPLQAYVPQVGPVRPGATVSVTPTVTGRIGSVGWAYDGTGPLLMSDPATGVLTGTAGAPGTIEVGVLTATDSSDGVTASTEPFSIAVEAAPISIAVADSAWRLPASISFPVSVTGGYGEIELEADLPAGLALSGGTVSGTVADTGSRQALSATFTATDAYGTPGGNASATVTVNPAMSVSVPSYTTIRVNDPVNIPVTTAGVVGTGSLAEIAGRLPDGLVADYGAGAIVGTATASETVTGMRLELSDNADGHAVTSNPFSIRVNGVHLPGEFVVPAVNGVMPGTVAVSNAIPVEGYAGTLSISVAGGNGAAISLDGGETWSTGDDIASGQSFMVRQTASQAWGSTVTATVTIADKSAPFSVSTKVQDTTPVAFTLGEVTDSPLSQSHSRTATVTGIDGEVPVSVTGGTLLVNGQASTGTVRDGDILQVTVTASAQYGAASTATVTVGTYSTTFKVTTKVQDTTPVAFTFAAVTGAVAGQTYSRTATVTGIEGDVPVSVTGGTVLVNGVASSTIRNGDTLQVSVVAPSVFEPPAVATVTVGTYSTAFQVTKAQDTTPAGFTFAEVTASLPSVANTATATVTGIEGNVPVSVTGGSFTVNGSVSSTIRNGQTLAVTVSAPATYGQSATATVTVGTYQTTFKVTTKAQDTTPADFSFTAVTGANPSQNYNSNTVTVTGIEGNVPVSVSGGTVTVNGGSSTTIRNGETLRVSVTTPSGYGQTATATVTVGTYQTTYSVTTVAEIVKTVGSTSSATGLNVMGLFTAAEWSGSVPKRVVVNPNAVVGSTNPDYPAVNVPGGRGGTLVLEVSAGARIEGAGGRANGGKGGDAIANVQAITIRNNGTIRSGGGGGGKGGNGGPGYTQSSYTHTETQAGGWLDRKAFLTPWYTTITWAGTRIYGEGAHVAQVNSGGWTYTKGAFTGQTTGDEGNNVWNYYGVVRSQLRTSTTYTSGGVSGNAGRGQGHDGSAGGAAAAVAGGTNAGYSGTSGKGGGWGASGDAGSNGQAGNNGSGTNGQAGGLAGFAVTGPHTFEVAGTKLGR